MAKETKYLSSKQRVDQKHLNNIDTFHKSWDKLGLENDVELLQTIEKRHTEAE